MDNKTPIEVQTIVASEGIISNVSIYPSRAEITRAFNLELNAGRHQLLITDLPSALDKSSLRFEGKGSATINNVAVGEKPQESSPTTWPELDALLYKRQEVRSAQYRVQQCLQTLEAFLVSVAHSNSFEEVKVALEGYRTEAKELQLQQANLNVESASLDKQIKQERTAVLQKFASNKLKNQANVSVSCEGGGKVELVMRYAVTDVSWDAQYAVYASLESPKAPIVVVYQAVVSQSTGEDWDNAPVILETVFPTSGQRIPDLDIWTIYSPRPATIPGSVPQIIRLDSERSYSHLPQPIICADSAYRYSPPPMALVRTGSPDSMTDLLREIERKERAPIVHRIAPVWSQGGISATFRVPGSTTILSNGQAHIVTIAQLELDAPLEWVGVPKKDTRMHLIGHITNTSDYFLLPGAAHVYLDGSFIAQTRFPSASPQETFDCPFGVDPSIRAVYHPVIKKTKKSGLYEKIVTHSFSQRITISNTKSYAVKDVVITDHIPVSQDDSISVKLVSPPLKGSRQVKVDSRTVASWADDEDEDGGKVKWKFEVPAMDKVNLMLEWEVTAPVKVPIYGL